MAPVSACTNAGATIALAMDAGASGCCFRERAGLAPMSGPRRIVCLTEEPTETLYALGEQDRIVGISGFTVRPAIARQEKPKVSPVNSANIDEILKLQPDFVVDVYKRQDQGDIPVLGSGVAHRNMLAAAGRPLRREHHDSA